MKISWKSELPLLVLLALMFALAAANWNTVPDRVPVHWGLDGRPNGWGPRGVGLLGLPVVGAFTYLLLLIVPLLDPGRAQLARSGGAITLLRGALLVMLIVLEGAMIESFHGANVDMTAVVLPLLGAFLVLMGPILSCLGPNYTAGIRTPWTLTSRVSWEGTHRAASRVFPLAGLVWIGAGIVRGPWAVPCAFGVLVLAVVGLAAYSWVLWRDDPDKVAPGGPPRS